MYIYIYVCVCIYVYKHVQIKITHTKLRFSVRCPRRGIVALGSRSPGAADGFTAGERHGTARPGGNRNVEMWWKQWEMTRSK